MAVRCCTEVRPKRHPLCYNVPMKNLKTLINDYLNESTLMQVATSAKDQPWACSVYFAFDSDFNLYWISSPKRRHSQEIVANEKVAGTIVLPHTPGDDVRGISFQGVATELKGKAALSALMIYAKRLGMSLLRVKKIVANKDGHVCYKIKPNLIVLFDEVNFPKDPRQEFKL